MRRQGPWGLPFFPNKAPSFIITWLEKRLWTRSFFPLQILPWNKFSLPPAIALNSFPNRNHYAKYAKAKIGKEVTSCTASCHVESPLPPQNPKKLKEDSDILNCDTGDGLRGLSGPAFGITHNLNSSCPCGIVGCYCFCFNKNNMPV